MPPRAAARGRRHVSRRPVGRRPVSRRPVSRRRKSVGKGKTTIALVFAALLVAVAAPLCLVFGSGMAPAIVAAIVDRHPQRYLTRTISVLNLAGMVLPVITLLQWGLNLKGAEVVLFDPYMWLWMYGAAAIGWLCYLGMPSVARSVVEGRDAHMERDLKHRAKDLVDEWGEGVTGRKYEGR